MNPLDALAPDRTGDCLSDLAIDRWLTGEAARGEVETFEDHLAGCARCRGRHAVLAAEREAWIAAPIPPKRAPARSGRRRGWIAAAGALAMAAAALLAIRSAVPSGDGPGTRRKGAKSMGFYVKDAAGVRPGATGERVAPGDALRFTYTSDEDAWFAVLSVDGAGRASVYYPAREPLQLERVVAGRDVPLPASTVLDEVLGDEVLLGLFCRNPIEVAALLRAFERDANAAPPAGCSVDRLRIHKGEGAP